jgi:hypothetical protein
MVLNKSKRKTITMTNENLIKTALIFGGGFALFMALKPKQNAQLASGMPTAPNQKSFDSSAPAPTKENAEIVANAYAEAMKSGEPPARLTELNKECMAEFGMRCYMDKSGQLIVCDVSGNTIMTK